MVYIPPQLFLASRVVDSYHTNMNKKELLLALHRNTGNTAQGTIISQNAKEIRDGLALKQAYLDSIGISSDQANFSAPEYEYIADKANIIPYAYKTIGQVSTDPEVLAGEQSGRNELLANYPIYKALLEEQNK